MKFFRRKPSVAVKVLPEPETVEASSVEEYFNRGMLYYSREKFDQALSDFQSAANLDAMAVDPYYGLGLVYKAQEKNDEAIAAFKKVLELIDQGVLDQKFDKKNMLQKISRSHIRSLTETA